MELINIIPVRLKAGVVKRYGMYKCPLCNKPFKTRVLSANSGSITSCLRCRKTVNRIPPDIRKRDNRLKGFYKRIEKCETGKINDVFKDFDDFLEWSLENGYTGKSVLRRIDKEKCWVKSNLKWKLFRKEKMKVYVNGQRVSSNNEEKFKEEMVGKTIKITFYDIHQNILVINDRTVSKHWKSSIAVNLRTNSPDGRNEEVASMSVDYETELVH